MLHTLTRTPRCKWGLWRAKGRRLCVSGVSSRCKIHAEISYWSRDGRAIAGGVSGYSTAARPSGGRKRKGENPTGEFSTGYTVSCSSRQVRELVKWCCSCTRHLICSTTVPSDRACKFRTASQQCMGRYCWGKCRNKGRLMPSPITARGLLGIFPRGADPPSRHQPVHNNPARTIAKIFFPTGNIGGRGRGKGRKGRGKRPQGPARERGENSQRGRVDQGSSRTAVQRGIKGRRKTTTA